MSIKELRAECATLESAVLNLGLATAEMIAQARPGQPANQDTGPRGWLRFYGDLRVWYHQRLAAAEAERSPDIEAAVTRAATSQPEPVLLSIMDENAQRRQVYIYPKSRRALLCLDAWDAQIRYLGKGYRTLKALDSADDIGRLLPRVAAGIDLLYQLLCWSVVTPGPWLPFDPKEAAPTPPEWLSTLSVVDTLAIALVHRRVNLEQIQLLSKLIGGLDQSDGPGVGGWGAFIASAAHEQGVAMEVLDRDVALTALLAQTFVRAKALDDIKKASAA